MAKKRSYWELILELNNIINKETWNQLNSLENDMHWNDLDLETKTKVENKVKEITVKLETLEEDMARKQKVKKPKVNKYEDKKGPKPVDKVKRKKK